MGIDVYMRWKDQTDDEHEAQITGFSATHGHVGYLREAYHGGPYGTHVLVKEAFDESAYDDEGEGAVPIAAKVLRERLPATERAVRERHARNYPDEPTETGDPIIKSFQDFVDLAERKEAETGEPVLVRASY